MRVTCAGSDLGGRRLEGVNLEIAGLGVSFPEYTPGSWPIWWIVEGLDTAIKIEEILVTHPATPVYGKIVCLDARQVRMSIHGLEPDDPLEDSMRVHRWLRVVVNRVRRAGRRPETYDIPNEELSRQMRQGLDKLRAKGDVPTEAKLMAVMGIQGDTRRVREWLDRLGFLSFEDFVQSTDHPLL
jgi:hypothetical protein